MRMLMYANCNKCIHLANAVMKRMHELGYINTLHVENVFKYGYWIEKGRREQITPCEIPNPLLPYAEKGKYEEYEIEDKDDFSFQELDLQSLFHTEVYKFKKPEVKVVLTRKYTAVVKEDHVLVGCQKIEFDKVEQIYNAIQDLKNEESK